MIEFMNQYNNMNSQLYDLPIDLWPAMFCVNIHMKSVWKRFMNLSCFDSYFFRRQFDRWHENNYLTVIDKYSYLGNESENVSVPEYIRGLKFEISHFTSHVILTSKDNLIVQRECDIPRNKFTCDIEIPHFINELHLHASISKLNAPHIKYLHCYCFHAKACVLNMLNTNTLSHHKHQHIRHLIVECQLNIRKPIKYPNIDIEYNCHVVHTDFEISQCRTLETKFNFIHARYLTIRNCYCITIDILPHANVKYLRLIGNHIRISTELYRHCKVYCYASEDEQASHHAHWMNQEPVSTHQCEFHF